MIYQVTSSNPHLQGQRARFKVDAQGYIVSAFFDGREMVVVMTECVGLFTAFHRRASWQPLHDSLSTDAQWNITVEEEKKELPVNKRIELFCIIYKEFKGVPYKVTPAEAGMMKGMPVTEPLLRYYLDDAKLPDTPTTWLWKHKQGIKNMKNYWNQVVAAMVTPTKPKSRHPDKWDREHYKKLDGEGITEYYRHLKGLGLVPRKHTDGSTIDWVKSDASTQ